MHSLERKESLLAFLPAHPLGLLLETTCCGVTFMPVEELVPHDACCHGDAVPIMSRDITIRSPRVISMLFTDG